MTAERELLQGRESILLTPPATKLLPASFQGVHMQRDLSCELHGNPFRREQMIRRYLRHGLPRAAAAALERHYLVCGECFEQVRIASLLMGVSQNPRRPRLDLIEVK
jgi:hypothetical protein